MILEGLVTTLNDDGTVNVAPMGPKVEPEMDRFVLRPYRTSRTYANLVARREGVLHVTDDVLMLARAAIGLTVEAEFLDAEEIRGRILAGACRYFEFRVIEVDDRDDRTTLRAQTVRSGRLRDHFGLNRAKHAVVEAAILATRVEFLPTNGILADLERLAPLVEKTGGVSEQVAFELLRAHVARAASERGQEPDRPRP